MAKVAEAVASRRRRPVLMAERVIEVAGDRLRVRDWAFPDPRFPWLPPVAGGRAVQRLEEACPSTGTPRGATQ